jgi:hypothetical protein
MSRASPEPITWRGVTLTPTDVPNVWQSAPCSDATQPITWQLREMPRHPIPWAARLQPTVARYFGANVFFGHGQSAVEALDDVAQQALDDTHSTLEVLRDVGWLPDSRD